VDDTLSLKLIVTPGLIAVASLAGRRWGPSVSGWLVGLPLTSGPITFFLALSLGPGFAGATAKGTLLGTASQALVCLAYAWLSKRRAWPMSLAASIGVFAVSTWLVHGLDLPLAQLMLLVVAMLIAILVAMPPEPEALAAQASLPKWDLPARMVVVTVYVIGLTAAAPWLGAQLAGMLSPFPLYGLVLAVFGHHLSGSPAAIRVMRGLVAGLFSFATFFCVIAATIERVGLWQSFAMATVAVTAVQAGALWAIRTRWM
jgi:hypothetical protein